MSTRTPTSPLRAHHRYMKALMGMVGKGLSPNPDELDRVSRVFKRAGGSWEKLFKGSNDDLTLLKKVLKVAAEKGILSKSPKWNK